MLAAGGRVSRCGRACWNPFYPKPKGEGKAVVTSAGGGGRGCVQRNDSGQPCRSSRPDVVKQTTNQTIPGRRLGPMAWMPGCMHSREGDRDDPPEGFAVHRLGKSRFLVTNLWHCPENTFRIALPIAEILSLLFVELIGSWGVGI